jgi:hypothetical protein
MTKTLNGEGRGIYGLPGQDIFITQIEFALDKTLVGIWLVIRSFSIRYSFSFFHANQAKWLLQCGDGHD